MAREFIEGFESGGLGLWDYNNGPMTVVAAQTGMSGSYCLSINQFNYQAYKNLTSRDEYYMAFLFRFTTLQIDNNGCNVVAFYKADGTILGRLAMDYFTRVISARSNANAVLASGPALNYTQTYLIEVRYKPNTSGGIWQVKIDGAALCIDFSGNTGLTGQIGRIAFGSWDSYGPQTGWIDNIVVDTANWIGSTKIVGIVPTGAGDLTQFTPSAGANYQTVDELPVSDADYNSVNTVDQTDLFTHGALPGVASVVKAVQVQFRSVKEGASTPQNIQSALKIGATVYNGTSKGLTFSFADNIQMQELSPATGIAWTVDEVNNAQFGYKSKA